MYSVDIILTENNKNYSFVLKCNKKNVKPIVAILEKSLGKREPTLGLGFFRKLIHRIFKTKLNLELKFTNGIGILQNLEKVNTDKDDFIGDVNNVL